MGEGKLLLVPLESETLKSDPELPAPGSRAAALCGLLAEDLWPKGYLVTPRTGPGRQNRVAPAPGGHTPPAAPRAQQLHTTDGQRAAEPPGQCSSLASAQLGRSQSRAGGRCRLWFHARLDGCHLQRTSQHLPLQGARGLGPPGSMGWSTLAPSLSVSTDDRVSQGPAAGGRSATCPGGCLSVPGSRAAAATRPHQMWRTPALHQRQPQEALLPFS